MKSILIVLIFTTSQLCTFVKRNTTPEKFDENLDSLDLKVYGIQINVADINEGIAFYSNIIGFPIESKTKDYVKLHNDGINLILHKVYKTRKNNFPNETRTHIVLHTNNLDSLTIYLRNKGIRFVEEEIENGVGCASIIEDYFGNKVSLMEQSKFPVPFFKEPKIYNVGYSMNDLEKAKEFYCSSLGFYVRTTKYLPALPLGHKDSTFAFMLHQKNVAITEYYPDETQTMIVFSTKNIDSTIRLLQKKGIIVNKIGDSTMENQNSYYVTDPFGNIFKLIEIN